MSDSRDDGRQWPGVSVAAPLSVGVGAAAEAQPAAYDLARPVRNGQVRAGRSWHQSLPSTALIRSGVLAWDMATG
jgi:hypothetical protein